MLKKMYRILTCFNNHNHPSPSFFFHLIALILASWSFVDRYSIVKSLDYCRMSYMWPAYSPVQPVDGLKHPRYQLFRYSEGGSYYSKIPLESIDAIPVLFIPGSAGSYGQVRSIASDSTYAYVDRRNLSSIKDQLLLPLHFYTLDFKEEFSAFHGHAIQEQSNFTSRVIQYLFNKYNQNLQLQTKSSSKSQIIKKVLVLAHSMGGIVARHSIQNSHKLRKMVKLVLTLSTPHAAPPLPYNKALFEIYQEMHLIWREDPQLLDFPLVSIGGGLSDVLVDGHLTNLENSNHHHLATASTSIPSVWTSADHKMIVWCNQLMNKLSFGLLRSQSLDTAIQVASYWRSLLLPGPLSLSSSSSLSNEIRTTELFASLMKKSHYQYISGPEKNFGLIFKNASVGSTAKENIYILKPNSHRSHLSLTSYEMDFEAFKIYRCMMITEHTAELIDSKKNINISDPSACAQVMPQQYPIFSSDKDKHGDKFILNWSLHSLNSNFSYFIQTKFQSPHTLSLIEENEKVSYTGILTSLDTADDLSLSSIAFFSKTFSLITGTSLELNVPTTKNGLLVYSLSLMAPVDSGKIYTLLADDSTFELTYNTLHINQQKIDLTMRSTLKPFPAVAKLTLLGEFLGNRKVFYNVRLSLNKWATLIRIIRFHQSNIINCAILSSIFSLIDLPVYFGILILPVWSIFIFSIVKLGHSIDYIDWVSLALPVLLGPSISILFQKLVMFLSYFVFTFTDKWLILLSLITEASVTLSILPHEAVYPIAFFQSLLLLKKSKFSQLALTHATTLGLLFVINAPALIYWVHQLSSVESQFHFQHAIVRQVFLNSFMIIPELFHTRLYQPVFLKEKTTKEIQKTAITSSFPWSQLAMIGFVYYFSRQAYLLNELYVFVLIFTLVKQRIFS